MGEKQVEAFLRHRTVNRRLAESTQNQALPAILFRHVLEHPEGSLEAVRASKPYHDSRLTREPDQLERRIKTTVGLLAVLAFQGLDEIRSVLTQLKRKRDAVERRLARQAPAEQAP